MPRHSSLQVEGYAPTPSLQLRALLEFARAYFNPEFLGLWELDLQKPALFVGNHTLFGLTDAPLMIEHLYRQYQVMLRSLGDRGHFMVPGWRSMLESYGMVPGTPQHCSALMRGGASVLVFPGGAREVFRRKGEAYQLMWQQRTGFVRLAIEHGYDIIPFGSVGPDESFRILFDGDDMMKSRIWQWLTTHTGIERYTRGGEILPPISRGVGLSLLPRPQRYYFGFGPRISTETLRGMQENTELVWALREQVQASVELQIARLLQYREQDRELNWSWLRRWLAPELH